MNFKNANIGVAVGTALLLIGCWLAGWDVNESEGPVIMVVSFLSAIGVTLVLDERSDRARDRRR
jgi:hypothetical protein